MAASQTSAVEAACGSHSLPFLDLLKARDWLLQYQVSHPYLQVPSYHVQAMMQTSHAVRSGYPQQLLSLLLRHRSFDASDKRDRIYGLLGLASDVRIKASELTEDEPSPLDHTLSIAIRYAENYEYDKLYRDVSSMMLAKADGLDMLGTPHVVDVDEFVRMAFVGTTLGPTDCISATDMSRSHRKVSLRFQCFSWNALSAAPAPK